jgi:hypothetical protein
MLPGNKRAGESLCDDPLPRRFVVHFLSCVSPSMTRSPLLACFLCALCLSASAQTTTQEWQAKAVQKYPQLGTLGTPLNKAFTAEYARRMKTDPDFFRAVDWPMRLADELAPPQPAILPPDADIEAARAKAFQEGSTFFIWRKEKNPIKAGNPVVASLGPQLEFELSFDLNPAKAWEPYQIQINHPTILNGRNAQIANTIKMFIKPDEKSGQLPISFSLPGYRTTGKGVLLIHLIKDKDGGKREAAPPISNILTVPVTFDN